MTDKVKILAFSGSLREGSYNKMLVQVAAAGATQAGADVSYLDLREFPLPLYDGDLETNSGLPENVPKLKKIFVEHHGLLISSPEYNSSFSAVLKNTIDWISRPAEGEKSMIAFNGKVAAIMAASPGALGGLRGLIPLRMLLENINVMVIPDQLAIPKAHEAFDPQGGLQDKAKQSQAEGLGKKLVQIVQKLI